MNDAENKEACADSDKKGDGDEIFKNMGHVFITNY